MMVTVTLDEITVNAINAALDERITRLEIEIARLNHALKEWAYSDDYERAVVWSIAALHQTKLAREYLSDVELVVDHPADATYATA